MAGKAAFRRACQNQLDLRQSALATLAAKCAGAVIREETMRLSKNALVGVCAFGLFAGIAQAEPVKIRASYIVPPERFGWVFTEQDNYRSPDMLPNLEVLRGNVNFVRDLGYVKQTVDVPKHADLSLVQEAAKRLE
jgi:hypothetical protein